MNAVWMLIDTFRTEKAAKMEYLNISTKINVVQKDRYPNSVLMMMPL